MHFSDFVTIVILLMVTACTFAAGMIHERDGDRNTSVFAIFFACGMFVIQLCWTFGITWGR